MRAAGVLCLSALLHAASPRAASVVDAAMQGNRDAVKELLKDGADVNTAQGDGMTALHWAVQKSDIELAKMLLYAGANVKATTRIGSSSATASTRGSDSHAAPTCAGHSRRDGSARGRAPVGSSASTPGPALWR